jgi:hypothetical protein
MISGIEALITKAKESLAAAHVLIEVGDYGVGSHVPKEFAETVCDWAIQFTNAAELLLQSHR